jgi:hypothetical protein
LELPEIVRKAFEFHPYRFTQVFRVGGWVVGPTFMVRQLDMPVIPNKLHVPILMSELRVSSAARRIANYAPSLDPSVAVQAAKHEDACSGRYVTRRDTPVFELAYPLYRFVSFIKPEGFALDQDRRLYLYHSGFLEAVLMCRTLCSERRKVVRRERGDRLGRPPTEATADQEPPTGQAMGIGGGASSGDPRPQDVPRGSTGRLIGLHRGPP